MPSVAKQEAVDRLADVLSEPVSDDDLAEYYNELFPQQPLTVAAAALDRQRTLRQVLSYVRQGLEPEEIVDLWNVIYPSHRRVHFDEVDDKLCFSEAVGPADADDD